jgi:hypothetical protein
MMKLFTVRIGYADHCKAARMLRLPVAADQKLICRESFQHHNKASMFFPKRITTIKAAGR